MESEMARDPQAASGTETTKEDLRRRMEEARESITQTVADIKDEAAGRYRHAGRPAGETVDWREQVQEHPLLYGLGAFAAGALTAYALWRASRSSGEAREDYGRRRVTARERAVGRLEGELAELEDRLIGELSDIGRNVVLPLFTNKLKERFGIDLSTPRQAAEGAGEAGRLRAWGREAEEFEGETLLPGEESSPESARTRDSFRDSGDEAREGERGRAIPDIPDAQVFLSEEELPAYHEGMLILRLKPQPESFMIAMSEGFDASEAFSASPGLSVLSLFEEAGKVKRVIPLARRRAEAFAETSGLMDALSFTLSPAVAEDPNAGVSVVELEHDSDADALRTLLERDPNVESVSRVPVRYLLASPSPVGDVEPMSVPPADLVMWNLHKVRWEEARQLSGFKEATEVNVAVFDTGVDPNHPDLAGRVRDYVFTHPKLPELSSDRDLVGHGTHVCGTIGALIGNDFGVNGICECRLHVWKIFNDVPRYIAARNMFAYVVDPVMYRAALADCVDMDIDVVNLSIGGPGLPDDNERRLFSLLVEKGTAVVAAMGNSRVGGSPTFYPAALPNVIAVGATSVDDSVASFSNAGDHITLSAPGVAIWSTMPTYTGEASFFAVPGPDGQPVRGRPILRETNYAANQGTSMAAPHVTAAVALLLAKYGKISVSEVRDRLVRSVDSVPGMGGSTFHRDFGAGRLNLLRLLQ